MPAFPGAATSKGSGMSTVAGSTAYVGSARGPTAEEMRREVQAIRLRNAMDPKRFYKGGKGDKGMPKFAQVSRVAASGTEARLTQILPPAARKDHWLRVGACLSPHESSAGQKCGGRSGARRRGSSVR